MAVEFQPHIIPVTIKNLIPVTLSFVRLRIKPEHNDLRLNCNLRGFLHALLYLCDQFADIGCGGTALIHHKTSVLLRNLRTADSKAPKPCILY